MTLVSLEPDQERFGITCQEEGCRQSARRLRHVNDGGSYGQEALLPFPDDDGWKWTGAGWLCPDHAPRRPTTR